MTYKPGALTPDVGVLVFGHQSQKFWIFIGRPDGFLEIWEARQQQNLDPCKPWRIALGEPHALLLFCVL